MPRSFRNALLWAAAVPAALIVVTALVFAADRFAHRGEVLRNVSVNGIALDGMDADRARVALATMEAELSAEPALFTVDGTEFVLLPSEVGFDIGEDALVAQALDAGRTGSLPGQFGWWLARLRGSDVELTLPITVERRAIEDVVAAWEEEAVDARVEEGGVEISGTQAVPVYPRRGRTIDRDEAIRIVGATMAVLQRPKVDIPVVDVEPTLTPADVDAAVEEANLVLAGPVTLARDHPEVEVTFTPEQLAGAFRSEVEANSPVRIDLYFDVEAVDRLLAPLRPELELPPADASFRVNADETVTLIPGHPGTIIDAAAVAEELFAAAKSFNRTGDFPFVEGVEPEFTTEEAEAMMPITKVSEFTTKHNCCEARVENIQRFADIVDGTFVWPGQVLSLNELVGRRTTDKGFVPAPMIERGELVDDVGGGVSQFATTFYNAVFFGGYEDVEHSPHSIYISRYPEGREATISWPAPDLKFRNNTDAVVIIKTAYTDTSITVKFFGNNGGIEVEAAVSGRSNVTEPRERYEADPSVRPGSERIRQSGSQGWTVTVTRTIRYPDGREPKVEKWTERYVGAARIIVRHPCEVPAGTPGASGQPCPTGIPPLGGLTAAEAQARVEAAGYAFALGEPIPVSPESGLNGLVADHTSGFAPPGSTVTVRLGFVEPSATSTTSTTVPPSSTSSTTSSTTTTSTLPPSSTTTSTTTTTTSTTTTTTTAP